jgi:ABC-type transport system involved in multi-copper enzyme maturation permease subunit
MKTSAVIDRELRVAARQPFTYWLRTAGVAALLVVCGYAVLTRTSELRGAEFFSFIHIVLFIAIWVVVPLLTADCISSERREGTLPLLFLTRLTARQIVAAKGAAQSFRALTLWGAALPVAAIAFLLGGVTWKEAVISACINLSSILFALSAGLVASSLCRRWGRALGLATALSVFFFFLFILVHVLLVDSLIRVFAVILGASVENVSLWEILQFTTDVDAIWASALTGIPIPAQLAWVTAEIIWVGLAALWFFGVLRCAAWRIRKNWRQQPNNLGLEKAEAVFCRPMIGKDFLTRWLRRTLERNPVGWLERRTWSGRMITWIWCGVMTLIYCAVSSSAFSNPGFIMVQNFLVYLLICSMSASAAGSFRRERDNGVMELLLVSPIGEWRLIEGRLRVLWMQFAPAFGLLFAVWAWWDSFNTSEQMPLLAKSASYLTIFLTLPIIGLYFSLAKKNFISAFLWTLFIGGILPVLVQGVYSFGFFPGRYMWKLWGFIPRGGDSLHGEIIGMLLQIVVAGFFGMLLYSNLRNRTFEGPRRSAA